MANMTIRRRNFIQTVLASDIPSGIALSKLTPGSNGDVLKVSGGVVTSGKVTDSEITDNTIAVAKLVASATSGHVLQSNGSAVTNGYVTNSNIVDDSIGITKITKGTAHYVAKTNSGGTAMELGLIGNSNIDSAANIAVSKLADGTARQILAMNTAADTPTWTSMTFGTTLYVAASDATAAEKSLAHYICDGTDDDTDINAAITALPANGGKVVLSSGQFTITNGVTINKNYTLVEGSGYNTVIKFKNSVGNSKTLVTMSQWYTSLQNLRLDGNKSNNVGASGHTLLSIGSIGYPVVENVYIADSAVYGVLTGSNMSAGKFTNVTVVGCLNLGMNLDGCGSTKIANQYTNCLAAYNGTEGFSVAGFFNVLTNCVSTNNVYNFTIGANPYNQLIGCKSSFGNIGFYLLNAQKNLVSSCVSIDDGSGFQCSSGASNNVISGCHSYSASAYGFLISGTNSNKNHLVGNYSHGDNYGLFQIDSNSYNSFQGNHVEDSVGHGIYIGGGSHHSVLGNIVIGAAVSSSVYAGIVVVGSDYNTIMNNVVRKGAGLAAYGISIGSGYYNLVGPNDLILAGATAPLNDAGTATRKTVMVAQSTQVSSGTLAEVTANTLTDITDMSITIVSGGGDIEVELCGLLTNNTNNTYAAVGFSLNGADTVDLAAFTPNTAGQYGNASCFYRWNGTAAGTSYTIKARMRTQTATTTKAQMYGRSMKVRELRNY